MKIVHNDKTATNVNEILQNLLFFVCLQPNFFYLLPLSPRTSIHHCFNISLKTCNCM